jgi:hypothetical protein
MTDVHDSVRKKVTKIFRELVGDRTRKLDGSKFFSETKAIVTAALVEDFGTQTANDIAFHILDWNADAAFVVALHLFPERFTPEEIDLGIGMFLIHAPNHIREACRLTGTYVWESFPDQEDSLEKNDT